MQCLQCFTSKTEKNQFDFIKSLDHMNNLIDELNIIAHRTQSFKMQLSERYKNKIYSIFIFTGSSTTISRSTSLFDVN